MILKNLHTFRKIVQLNGAPLNLAYMDGKWPQEMEGSHNE